MLALVAILVPASAAVAQDRPGPPGRGPTPEVVCRDRVALILRGTFVSAGRSSFRMIVRSGFGRRRGRQELGVDSGTRFRRNGERSNLAELLPNDRLLVYARGCKRSAKAKRHALLARNVFAHGPDPDPDDEEDASQSRKPRVIRP